MPSAALLQSRLRQRILNSAHSVTIVYPAARPTVSAVSPGATSPTSPLTGAPPTQTLTATTQTPAKPSVTMKCLWVDGFELRDLKHVQVGTNKYGWYEGADAMMRVTVQDAQTANGTAFDGCDHIEHNGSHYTVLNVTPIGPGFDLPYTYNVWLKGMAKQ